MCRTTTIAVIHNETTIVNNYVTENNTTIINAGIPPEVIAEKTREPGAEDAHPRARS